MFYIVCSQFAGRTKQREHFNSRTKLSNKKSSDSDVFGGGGGGGVGLCLTQSELLSSLKALINIRHADVRLRVMEGLLEMMQGGGQEFLNLGWGVVVELVAAVPTAMVPVPVPAAALLTTKTRQQQQVPELFDGVAVETMGAGAGASFNSGGSSIIRSPQNNNSSSSSIHVVTSQAPYSQQQQSPQREHAPDHQLQQPSSPFQQQLFGEAWTGTGTVAVAVADVHWPKEALLIAFSCMQLIVEDFLEFLHKDVLTEYMSACLHLITLLELTDQLTN